MSREKILNVIKTYSPMLQIALDFVNLEDAVGLASLISNNVNTPIVYEIGTPLIKAEGRRAISIISKLVYPNLTVADTKTMDAGSLEAELAIKSGAKALTVLAAATDETIRTTVEKAHSLGGIVIVDFIGIQDPIRKIKKLEKLDIDVVSLHIGIDTQRILGISASGLVSLVREVKNSFNGFVAVAGGLKKNNIEPLISAGADIIVVGGAITRAKDPLRETLMILEILNSYKP